MMELNESFTGDTPTDLKQYFINKPVKLIGDLNTTTKIQDLIVNKDGSVNITFQNGVRLDSSIPMLTSFSVGINIPLQFKVRKKTKKLQEENSQETSGTDKQSRTQKIETMIDKTGIINTVNTVGGYNNFIKLYNKEFTKSEKIKLICDIVVRYSEDDDSEEPLEVIEFGIHLDYVEGGEYGSEAWFEMLDIDKNGGFLYNETEYLHEEGEYDWDNTRQGMSHLNRLSQKEIDDVFVKIIKNVKWFNPPYNNRGIFYYLCGMTNEIIISVINVLTPKEKEFLINFGDESVLRKLMSSYEIKQANKLVKKGVMEKGMSDDTTYGKSSVVYYVDSFVRERLYI